LSRQAAQRLETHPNFIDISSVIFFLETCFGLMQLKNELAPHLILYRYDLAPCKDTLVPITFTKNNFIYLEWKDADLFDPNPIELKPDRQMPLSFKEQTSETTSNCITHRTKKLLIHPTE
jgi:hypothetical protein